MLMGIKDNTGLGNNADELKTASLLFHNTVVRPIQEMILEAVDDVLAVNGASLNVYFKTLQPLELQADVSENEREEMGTNLSDDRPFLHDDLADELLEGLEGLGELESDLLEEYEVAGVEDAEGEPEEFDAEGYLNSRQDLAAQEDSEQDTDRYKVRYAYVKGTRKQPKGESRKLCSALIAAGRVYRKEDIQKLSSKGGAQAKGKEYSVWLYKGGANCHHRWERRIYRKKLRKDGEIYGGGALNGTEKVNVNQAVRQGFKLPKNPKTVAIAPIDTPTKGYKK